MNNQFCKVESARADSGQRKLHAHAREAPVQLDGELEDARWFELEQLRCAAEGLLPPPHTIARRLIEAWVQEQTGA